MTVITGALQLGLIYSLMAIGLYVTFKILGIPDLTVEGSFTFGMAVAVSVTKAGYPELSLVAAMAAGAAAGLVTGLLQTKVKIAPILAGIITMTGLYSINMTVMGGKANISLLGSDTVFTKFMKITSLGTEAARFIILIFFAGAIASILSVFFRTRPGLKIRATGDNEDMVRSSSINADATKCAAFMIGNACVALSGALACHYVKYADISYGIGTVVVGLASIIIGETLFGRRGVTIGFVSAAAGSVIYQFIVALAFRNDTLPTYWMKFISAAIVAAALSLPSLRTAITKRIRGHKNG